MKKTYQLIVENKKPERVIEAIKNDIRKYIKREKRKPLPEGTNVWNMDCKFSKNEEEPQVIVFQDIIKSIDEAAQLNCKSIYVEIISSAIKKEKKIEEIVANDTIVEENQDIEPINN